MSFNKIVFYSITGGGLMPVFSESRSCLFPSLPKQLYKDGSIWRSRSSSWCGMFLCKSCGLAWFSAFSFSGSFWLGSWSGKLLRKLKMFSNRGEKQERERLKQLQLKVCYPTGGSRVISRKGAWIHGFIKSRGMWRTLPKVQRLGYEDSKVVYTTKESVLIQL